MKRMAQEPSSTKEWTSSVLLRRGSSNKIPLKEKFVQIYEAFFQGEDPSTGNPNFWDELFLLKAFKFAMDQELVDYLKTILNENNCTELVKSSYIEAEFDKLNGDALVSLKENINLWFYKCVETLKQQASPIRIVNAIHTLCALIRGVFRKSLNNYGFDVINILIGFDMAEHLMQSLIESLNNFLTGEFSTSLKQLSLKLLLVLATATDNISQNTMLEYILINCVFESLVLILGNSIYRQTLGHDAVLLLTLLVQYRKYESANPYIVKLSILDDELALTGYAQVVSSSLTDFNREYQTKNAEPQSGWFSAIANMVGNMFVAEEKTVESVRANDSILLALYEAIHLNRNFITALTHTHTPSSPATPPVSPVSPASVPFEGQDPNLNSNPDEPTKQPTNLLVTFLEYSSIVMQDTKDETRHSNAKLCLIILTCIAEDQYANSLMTDSNMTFRVPLHRMPMRHRKVKVDKFPMCRPLVCALLDLMVEFILSHLMKNFPSELHLRCLGIIHRVLCYQKKCRVRLQYAWKDLWTALMNLLKFVLSHESHLLKKHNIFHIASKVVNIFNLFITYGDTFLPNPTSYDELYYEIIRMHQVFDNVYSMAMKVGEPALRYTTNEGEWKDSAAKLKNHLGNIRAIINHFTPKVDSWAAQNHLASLTEEQVLEVVRNNYDTLTLKLQDSLDQFERYSEKPRETSFFTQLVRSITCDVRKSVTNLPPIQHDDLLHEYPMIS